MYTYVIIDNEHYRFLMRKRSVQGQINQTICVGTSVEVTIIGLFSA